ncbi:MAG: RluA family pseudouridine synthase [Oscillospiraceae bacterium]|nr:RluA family pseudouridine synthase [Oscillospiraceae bacterium]
MKQIYITKNEKSMSAFLQDSYPLLKTGTLNKFLRANKIKVNGKKVPLNTPLKKGDVINLYIEDTFFEKPDKNNAFKFSSKNLEIIFEDDNLLIVNKQAGIAVIDDNWQNYDTLINRVKNHYFINNIDCSPALCHRLDTGTSGLVMLAKNDDFLQFMLEMFKDKELEKEYVCVVKGIPEKKSGLYNAYLTKNAKDAYVTVTPKARNNQSKPISTHITLLESYGDYSLLKIGLITGRTHQIRAHLAYLNMPILGDSRYGINNLNRQLKMKYQALCSRKIKFGTITDERYNYLSGKEFICPDPWFVDSFNKREFK